MSNSSIYSTSSVSIVRLDFGFAYVLLCVVILTNLNKMEEVKLSNGMMVLKSNYIKLKTKDLKEFGYTSLTEIEVAEQVEKILKKEDDLSVIGMLCNDDFDVE